MNVAYSDPIYSLVTANPVSYFLNKFRLLLRRSTSLEIGHAVLDVELDIDVVTQTRLASVEGTSLDNGLVAHGLHLQLGVQTGAAGRAEGVPVFLAAVGGGVVELGSSCLIAICEVR